MEQMAHFIKGIIAQAIMLLDALARVTIRTNNKDEVKKMIERMCQYEYHSSDRIVKTKGLLELDSNTTLLAQLEVISK